MSDGPKKQKQFNMRLNKTEWARLERIANHYGISLSEAIRMIVKREHDDLTVLGKISGTEGRSVARAAARRTS